MESCGEFVLSGAAVTTGKRDRCQSTKCTQKRESLEAELLQLQPLKFTFQKELADAQISARTEVVELKLKLENVMEGVKKNNVMRKCALKREHAVRAERGQLLAEIAELKGALHVSQAALAQHVRREELDARARGRTQRQQQSEVERMESYVEDVESEAVLRTAASVEEVRIAEELLEAARLESARAREEADDERDAALEAGTALGAERYQSMLLTRQLVRAKAKASLLEERVKQAAPVARGCSADEWFSLQAAARRKRSERDRNALRGVLQSHPWRAEDLAAVLDEMGLLLLLFNTKEGWRIYFSKVHVLHLKLEREDFGIKLEGGLWYHLASSSITT